MLSSRRRFGSVVALILVLLAQGMVTAMSSDEAVDLLATRLDQSQIKEGDNSGLWPQSEHFLGPITAGMVCAYEWTGDPAYRDSAELSGYWILRSAMWLHDLMGDEAYAFARLSEVSDDPGNNVWRNNLVGFFGSMRTGHSESSTEEYLAAFAGWDPSTVLFYVANFLVAADHVGDVDTNVYRKAVIEHLYRVNDSSAFPVMALGTAVWALTVTNTPADTPIVAHGGIPNPYWDGVTVGDLPARLASHQVPEGKPFAGSFYTRFDHSDGGTGGEVCGYTEDAIFGALGLVAAASSKNAEGPSEEFDRAILAVRDALLQGVDEEGRVYEHLGRQGLVGDVFAGEMLQALWRIEQYLSRTDEPAEALLDASVDEL